MGASDGGAALVSLSWRIVSHRGECCALCFRLLWLGHWHDGWGSESSRPAAHRATTPMHMCSPPQLDLVVALTDAHYSQTYCNSLRQHCQPALTIYRLNYKHLHPTSYANFSIHAHVFAGIMLHGKHATSLDLWTSVIPEQANGKESIIDTRCNLAASLHWPPCSLGSCLWLVSMVKVTLFLWKVKNLLSLSLALILSCFTISLAFSLRNSPRNATPSSEMRCC